MSTRTHGSSGYHPNQPFLFPIDPASRQAMSELWHQNVEQAKQRLAKRDLKARQRIEYFIVQAHQQGFHWTNEDKILALLEAPLGPHRPSDLDVQPAPEPVAADVVPQEVHEETIAWSDDAIAQLHEGVLYYSLGLLHSKGNAAEKKRTLEWIWSEDVIGFKTTTVRGVTKKQPLRADQVPFTFQTCCRLSGVNYDELREGLKWEMRSVFPTLGFQPRN